MIPPPLLPILLLLWSGPNGELQLRSEASAVAGALAPPFNLRLEPTIGGWLRADDVQLRLRYLPRLDWATEERAPISWHRLAFDLRGTGKRFLPWLSANLARGERRFGGGASTEAPLEGEPATPTLELVEVAGRAGGFLQISRRWSVAFMGERTRSAGIGDSAVVFRQLDRHGFHSGAQFVLSRNETVEASLRFVRDRFETNDGADIVSQRVGFAKTLTRSWSAAVRAGLAETFAYPGQAPARFGVAPLAELSTDLSHPGRLGLSSLSFSLSTEPWVNRTLGTLDRRFLLTIRAVGAAPYDLQVRSTTSATWARGESHDQWLLFTQLFLVAPLARRSELSIGTRVYQQRVQGLARNVQEVQNTVGVFLVYTAASPPIARIN